MIPNEDQCTTPLPLVTPDAALHNHTPPHNDDMPKQQMGLHYLLDFDHVHMPDPQQSGAHIFELMQSICTTVGFRIVGKHLEIFQDPKTSPPGFASVLCIDQSHLSAHAYSDKGILACDAFTCGNLERCKQAGEMLRAGIVAMFPECRVTKDQVVDRFKYE